MVIAIFGYIRLQKKWNFHFANSEKSLKVYWKKHQRSARKCMIFQPYTWQRETDHTPNVWDLTGLMLLNKYWLLILYSLPAAAKFASSCTKLWQ